ncbi:MAG TPA: tRNA lysidine(34) synthetase TilS [Gemmatimonadaceae bacterium]|nr:tRNA lysidine(34) synthetase TilS [Gemmatimonadaceae bacterium]
MLAVSGGRDSMVLLHAAARCVPEQIAAVVTVDHGTGVAATRAAALVERRSRTLGLEVVRSKIRPAAPRESAWRAARWEVLREEAAERNAMIATAHTYDDQAETVLMRVMRNAGARGLAALAASSGRLVRPLLGVGRAEIDAYAAAHAIEFVEDPSNRSLGHLRNRVRLELLPALLTARPELRHELVAIGRRAAAWREGVEHAVDAFIPHRQGSAGLSVAREALLPFGREELRVLWPALAARIGVVLDRRGTERLTSFTIQGRRGARIQLSGGVEAVRHRDCLLIRRADAPALERPRRLDASTEFGSWRFVRTTARGATGGDWEAELPLNRPLHVRGWRAGDRIIPAGERGGGARRVKRLLRESGVEAGIRTGWPVVLSGDEIVWVPGVRRGLAATVRSGRPVAVYRCERIDS